MIKTTATPVTTLMIVCVHDNILQQLHASAMSKYTVCIMHTASPTQFITCIYTQTNCTHTSPTHKIQNFDLKCVNKQTVKQSLIIKVHITTSLDT